MADGLTDVEKWLAQMEKVGASDLHLKAGSPPIFRVHGTPRRMESEPLSAAQLETLLQPLISPEQQVTLRATGSLDFAHGLANVGRFRINLYRQRGALSFCARRVNSVIPGMDELLLPESLKRIPALEDGLVLLAGPTGSGKSTTLASLINHVNLNRRCHILTIEDPIEYIYRDEKAFINQREVGLDVDNFATALKYALRQDPDVILVGEMRDTDTIETAMAAAETGHLVFATLHANNSVQTLGRVLDFFPGDRQNAIRQAFALTVRAVISQRLLKGATQDHPRVPAVETMFITPAIRKFIQQGEEDRIPEAIRNMAKDGMQDFNMSLYQLAKQGLISETEALDHSPNAEQLRMNLKGMALNTDQTALGFNS